MKWGIKYVICVISSSIVSFILMISGLVTQNAVFIFGGIYACVMICVILHECGHIVGCIINGNKLLGICIVNIYIKRNSMNVIRDAKIHNFCEFSKSKNDSVVYLMGPVFSFLWLLVNLFITYKLNNLYYLLYCTISFCVWVQGGLLTHRSDRYLCLNEMKKNKKIN